MEKIIYRIAMYQNKSYLTNRYSKEWFQKFSKESKRRLNEILPKVPDIGKSISSFNYKFAPSYIAWYLTLEEMGFSKDETTEIIWALNEHMIHMVPSFLMHTVGKSYFNSFRKKAAQHIQRQESTGVHPYDWQIQYRDVDTNCFEIDILACGIKKLAADFHAEGMLPGICRMDYLYASIMKNGFERTKTLGDGDDCCNCRYFLKGDCEWAPEKGFVTRK